MLVVGMVPQAVIRCNGPPPDPADFACCERNAAHDPARMGRKAPATARKTEVDGLEKTAVIGVDAQRMA
jgi:hypothetical protein